MHIGYCLIDFTIALQRNKYTTGQMIHQLGGETDRYILHYVLLPREYSEIGVRNKT